MTRTGDSDPCSCSTCADRAPAMTVVSVDARSALALCEDADGARVRVEISLLGPVRAGEVLLVHAGTALARAAEVAR